MTSTAARDLVAQTAQELAPLEGRIRSHPALEALEAGRVPLAGLRRFAAEQRAIVGSDRRSFATLAARFPEPPAGDLFLSLAQGEGEALRLLDGLDAALGLDAEAHAASAPDPDARVYPATLAWLALNGSRADVALSMLVNLDAWGANCARMAAALRARLGAGEQAVAFLEFFAHPPPELRQALEATIGQGLREGEPPESARQAARLVQRAELRFWDAVGRWIAADGAPGDPAGPG
jgi:hypothetical protein